MNDYFWIREPELNRWKMPYGDVSFVSQGVRSDGQVFAVTAVVSSLAVVGLRSEEQERQMLAETMKQLARGMESYLDPECICRVGQTEECPVRHPRKN